MNELSKERYVSPYRIAAIYAGLKEKDLAFQWLERAYDGRDASLIWLRFDPVLDSLRSDRRFANLLQRIGAASDSRSTAIFDPIKPSRRSRSSHPASAAKRPKRRTITALAILPLANTGDDPDMEYLSDGITESIINTLSQMPKLRVVARSTVFRYKDQQADPQEVGRLLDVQAVLTGRVRQIADRLIISTELIDVVNDSQLWGEHFNRNLSDIFAVQEEIAKEITEKLRLKLNRKDKGRLAKRHTRSVEAYQDYLKGRYHWNKRTIESLNKGIEYFKQAIDRDPSFAPAFARLSDSYTLLVVREALSPEDGFAKAKAAAATALKIDEAFAEAHASLGHAMLHNWEWDDAERALKRAIELNSGYASAHHWYSEHLTAMGRCDESIAELKLAGGLDPLSLVISADLGRAFYYAREYDQVMKQETKTLEMDSNFWLSHINLGRSYTKKGMHAEAISELQKARELLEGNTEALSFLGFAYAAAGKRDEALKILRGLDQKSKRSHVPPYHLAIIHAGLGDKDQTFWWLERAFEKRAVDLFTLKVEPMFDDLRRDPRFEDLLRRVGVAPPGLSEKRTSPGLEPGIQEAVSQPKPKAIAVLPFKPLSTQGRDEYLELGMADALITKLSDINQIVVRPTSSVRKYTDLEQDSATAGRELNVESVLEGSLQKLGDRIRVTARLVRVQDGSSLWTGKFDEKFTDIFAVEDSISERVAAALALKLSGDEKDRLRKRYTENIDAYQLYLKGRYHWHKFTAEALHKARGCFREAIELDPSYALAYVGLADTYNSLGAWEAETLSPGVAMPKAKAAAMKALEIDDTLAEAHASLAYVRMYYDWDWPSAGREFERAIELNPNCANAHHWRSHYLMAKGRNEESLRMSKRALELDPLAVVMNVHMAWHYYYARQYDEAVQECRKTLELEPNSFHARYFLGWAYERQGKYQEAISEFLNAITLSGHRNSIKASLAHTYALSGRKREAQSILDELLELSGRQYVSSFDMAIICAGLGEKDRAFRWLEQAYQNRSGWLVYLDIEPRFDHLRSEPRFQNLLRRVGLAPPAREEKPESPIYPSEANAKQAANQPVLRAIAVLPFKPIHVEGRDEILELGIADALITRLTKINQIAVRPTSAVRKYTSLDQDPLVIGRELRVESVLEGSIQKQGDRIRVTAQLVGVEDGRSLWAAQFDERFTDIFAVEDSISERVAGALSLKLTGEEMSRLTKHYTENVEAYQAYLRGRFFWNKRTTRWFKRGIEFFQQAIERDSDYALAYAGLADSYTLLVTWEVLTPEEGFSQAKTAARRALEIDSTLAEAHAGLAHTLLHTWEWSESEIEFKRAIDLNPGYALTHQWYSEYLAAIGSFDESIAEIKRALELDPLSVNTSHDVGRMLYLARRYDEAIEQLKQTIEMEPSFWSPHNLVGHAYTQKAMYEEAIAEFQMAMDFSGKGALSGILAGHAYAASGKKTEALAILDKLIALAKERYFSHYRVALIYAGLGYKDEMFEWLERAHEKRDANLIWLKVDPILDDFRSEAHFMDLLRRVGLAPPSSGEKTKSSPDQFAVETKQATNQPALRAIAVLPFKPLSTQGRDEYLELGMADALITKLSDINQIVVRPTSSVRKYTDLEQDSATAGRELNVESVLEGSLQKLGDRIRVTARLVRVQDGSSLWTGKFDEKFTDIFAVEDSISERVAAALALKLSGDQKDRLTKRYTENIAAYHLYLKGRYYWNKRSEESLNNAVECFKQAIEVDPNYTLAYAGLADCYTKLGDVGVTAMTPKEAFARARAAALRALEIDGSLAEIHASLGHLDMHLLQWADAERDFNRAIELNPNYASAHHWFAYYMAFHHRFDEALEKIGTASKLDPLSLPIADSVGEFLYFSRRNDEAIEQFRKVLEMDPNFLASRINLGRAYEQTAMFREAEEQFVKARQVTEESIDALAGLGHTHAMSGNTRAAREVLAQLTEMSKGRYVSPYDIALIHAALGETDKAFQWLEQAYDECAEWMIFTNVDPRLDPLRSDPRFSDLLARLGFAPNSRVRILPRRSD